MTVLVQSKTCKGGGAAETGGEAMTGWAVLTGRQPTLELVLAE